MGGRRFIPRPDQHSGSLNNSEEIAALVMTSDFQVFSDKDEKLYVPSHGTFTDLFLWDVKKPTSVFKKSWGQEPRWCGQPLQVVGLDRVRTAPVLAWDLSPVCAHSLRAGLCPVKLVNK